MCNLKKKKNVPTFPDHLLYRSSLDHKILVSVTKYFFIKIFILVAEKKITYDSFSLSSRFNFKFAFKKWNFFAPKLYIQIIKFIFNKYMNKIQLGSILILLKVLNNLWNLQ